MFSALRHRDFQLFVFGQFISLIGFWLQNVGQSWLVYRLTHSATYLGAIAFSQQIPILLLAVPAGGFVDRTNRHRMVMITQMLLLVQATVLSLLTFADKITIGGLFVLAALMGIISAFDLPARQAFLVQMVGKKDLMNAIAINSSMFNGARMIGPAIAGIVVAKWGESYCFLLNAVTYIAVIVSLLLMKIHPVETESPQSWARDLADGFRFVRETAPVRVMLQLVGAFGISGFSFAVLLPVFADRIFNRGATGLGWLMTAVGIGALFGALFLARRRGLKGISKLIAISAFGFALCLMLFSLSLYFWLSFGLLCLLGFFMLTMIASINTAIQSIIPDSFRGRVMSFFTTMLIGMGPIGSLIAGALADSVGTQIAVFVFALFCLAAAFWFYRSLPSIQAEGRRLYLLQNPQFGDPL